MRWSRRILRGAYPFHIDGKPLTLLKDDAVVNWATSSPPVGPRWPSPLPRCAPPRWCDTLAIEMKVQGPGEVGQYYRRAVTQALLYREFIRGAVPLHAWFTAHGLNAQACQAAVVVPGIYRRPRPNGANALPGSARPSKSSSWKWTLGTPAATQRLTWVEANFVCTRPSSWLESPANHAPDGLVGPHSVRRRDVRLAPLSRCGPPLPVVPLCDRAFQESRVLVRRFGVDRDHDRGVDGVDEAPEVLRAGVPGGVVVDQRDTGLLQRGDELLAAGVGEVAVPQ